MNRQSRLNICTYFVFLAIAVIGLLYGKKIANDYSDLRVWDIGNVLLMLVGIPFLFLQKKAAIPDFWENEISNKKRLAIPLLIGLVFGFFDVLIFKIILHPDPYDKLPPFLQPFPYSIFLYFSGAFEIEVFYRLIPITIICLFGEWYKKGKYSKPLFMVAAILTSVREPLEQFQTGALWLTIYAMVTGIAMNLLQAFYFKKTGFIGSLSVRLGHYLLWHIMLGAYVQYFEL